MEYADQLVNEVIALGAYNAGIIPVNKIPFDRELRKACEANHCGNYGKKLDLSTLRWGC